MILHTLFSVGLSVCLYTKFLDPVFMDFILIHIGQVFMKLGRRVGSEVVWMVWTFYGNRLRGDVIMTSFLIFIIYHRLGPYCLSGMTVIVSKKKKKKYEKETLSKIDQKSLKSVTNTRQGNEQTDRQTQLYTVNV